MWLKRHQGIFILLLVITISRPSVASLVYVPSKLDRISAKVVVVIHGCLQSAESMALGTGWNQLAEKNNLVVFYPQVPAGTNPIDCWNWYLPENQNRNSGQLKQIVDDLNLTKQSLKLRDPDIFLTGISSGGATVAGLMACFPKKFKAGAIHSGPTYGLAKSLKDGDAILKDGPSSQVMSDLACQPQSYSGSVIVFHGTADPIVNPKHALRIIADFVGNTSVFDERQVNVENARYTISNYVSSKSTKGRLVMINGLGHAWSGFTSNLKHASLLGPKGQNPTAVPFFSEVGPSATNLMWEFFSEVSQDSKKPKHR